MEAESRNADREDANDRFVDYTAAWGQESTSGAMNCFCTYCDQGYAARLLCLHESLAEHGEPFRLFVLCFDREVERVIRALGRPTLVAIPLEEILQADPEYAGVRTRRTPVEFYFTATPVIVRHCLAREPAAETVTYLDADLYFFAPVSAVLHVQGEASVGIVPHRFPPRLAERLIYGTYNVAWVSFRRDDEGLACLAWWRERCLEWCHDRVENGRFADQGYLDEFPKRFHGVRALDHAGINAGPWNVAEARVEAENGRVCIDGAPLLFFHYQGVREMLPGWFDPGFRAYGATASQEIRDLIYLPYLRRLAATQQQLRREFGLGVKVRHARENAGATWRQRWKKFKQRTLTPHVRRWRGELIHCPEPAP